MGGKSYYCDYCLCFMKNDLNVRKLHNAGISHSTAKASYMRRFEDPRKILNEERLKIPCKRYFAGYCKFQALCKFGHYNQKQLQQLEKIVSKLKKQRSKSKKNSQQTKSNLPPSLQSINIAKLDQRTMQVGWG